MVFLKDLRALHKLNGLMWVTENTYNFERGAHNFLQPDMYGIKILPWFKTENKVLKGWN